MAWPTQAGAACLGSPIDRLMGGRSCVGLPASASKARNFSKG
ncbi:Uncharacterised protein [Bordetella pertussis]|nr:Uncharacterised protein [Bordetella pertussis]